MTRTVVALGGNTLLKDGGAATEQFRRIEESADAIARLRETGRDLLLTHGNGPQVGHLLLQQEATATDSDDMPLDVLVAETQAQIGYPLQQALYERLGETVVTVVTQVLVDDDDPAFDEPTKPVGPWYGEAEAEAKPFETTEARRSDGEVGYRRVVPSPPPKSVVEADRITELSRAGATVIAGGGGGVPVVREDGDLHGVEAVVDKDRTAAALGRNIDADELLILTDVDAAYLDYGDPDQRPIREADAVTMREHLDAGEFGAGSMGPKIEAAVDFVEGGGDRAVVTSLSAAEDALAGGAGTVVTPE
ncbi:MAG: carbamate kinase [Halobacteriales archaeon]